jgi:putative copper export protein
MDMIAHTLHLLAATLWVGGLLFTSGVLSPVLRRDVAAPTRIPLVKAVGRRFSTVARFALLILFLTGLTRVRFLFFISPTYLIATPYGRLLLIKGVLFLLMLSLSLWHDFGLGPRVARLAGRTSSPEFQSALRKLTFWARVNVLVVIIIVICAAALRLTPR